MKTVHKLTSIYLIGIVLLCTTAVYVLLSFAYLAEKPVSGFLGPPPDEFSEVSRLSEEIHTLKLRNLVILGIAIFIYTAGGMYAIYIYRKKIVMPLNLVSSATQKMKHGCLEQFPVLEDDEMRTLAKNLYSLDRMLNDKTEELQKASQREKNVLRTQSLLNDLNRTLVNKVKIYEFLEIILSSSTTIIPSEVGAIALIDRNTHHITHFISIPSGDSGDIRVMARNIIRELVDKKTPLRLSSLSEERLLADIQKNMDMKMDNLLAVPIMSEEAVLGGLILINKPGSVNFTMEDKNHALLIAYQAAMAIEKSLIHEALLRSARIDELTGIDNHRTFHEKIHIELKRAERFGHPLSLLFIDIDFLKKFNDAYGVHCGDAAIKEIGGIFKKTLRRIDSVARYAGEDFAVILPETNYESAIKTAERIKREIGTHPFKVDGNVSYLTVSIGISLFPDDALTKEDLIKRADEALFKSKKSGRNRITSYSQYKTQISEPNMREDMPDQEDV